MCIKIYTWKKNQQKNLKSDNRLKYCHFSIKTYILLPNNSEICKCEIVYVVVYI